MKSVLMVPEFIISHVPSRNIRHMLSRIHCCVNSVSHHPISQRSAILFFRLWSRDVFVSEQSHCEVAEHSSSVFPKIIQFPHQKSVRCTAGNTTKYLPSDYHLLEVLKPYSLAWRNWALDQQFSCNYSAFSWEMPSEGHLQADPQKYVRSR